MVLLTRRGKDCDSEELLRREKVFCKPHKYAQCFSQPTDAAESKPVEVKDVLHTSSGWTYPPR